MDIPLVNFLDISREDTGLHVCASSGEEDIVRMPIDGENSRSDRFLQEFRNPPVVLWIEGTNGDGSMIVIEK